MVKLSLFAEQIVQEMRRYGFEEPTRTEFEVGFNRYKAEHKRLEKQDQDILYGQDQEACDKLLDRKQRSMMAAQIDLAKAAAKWLPLHHEYETLPRNFDREIADETAQKEAYALQHRVHAAFKRYIEALERAHPAWVKHNVLTPDEVARTRFEIDRTAERDARRAAKEVAKQEARAAREQAKAAKLRAKQEATA
jgi:hypothetical protein